MKTSRKLKRTRKSTNLVSLGALVKFDRPIYYCPHLPAGRTSMLTQLPDELLTWIFSYLDIGSDWPKSGRRPTLCALAATCRRFTSIAQMFMLQDITLTTGHVSSFHPLFTVDSLRNFARTCREKSQFINSMKSIELQADFVTTPDWGIEDNDKIPNVILQMVSQSTSVETLKLHLSGSGALYWVPSLFPAFHRFQFFTHLRSFYLDCGHALVSPTVFLALCALPSLREIETPSPIKSKNPDSLSGGLLGDWHDDIKGRMCGIETIRATHKSTSSKYLCRLLNQMPKLKELHMSVPGPDIIFDDLDPKHVQPFRLNAFSIIHVAGSGFSPAYHQSSLNHVAHSLRSLSMVNPRVMIAGHDNTLLNLSHFSQLEHLKLSVHFICPASLSDARNVNPPFPVPRNPHMNFHHLLPLTLQTLEIHYDSDQGIFYDPLHLYKVYHSKFHVEWENHLIPNLPVDGDLTMLFNELWTDRVSQLRGENGVRRRLGWLLGLEEREENVLPRLREVTVRETSSRPWLWEAFDLTARHPGLFGSDKLTIKVILRVPRGWKVPEVQEEVKPSADVAMSDRT